MTAGRGPRLRELARVFLKLGLTAFGGPAAHVALMDQEIVARRRWIDRTEFLDLLGAANVIPGPNSTELAIYVGGARAGVWGSVVAGASFILPAALITLGLAWAYVAYGALPPAQGALYGAKPVILAIIVQAIVRLGRTALRTRALSIIAAASVAASLFGVHELVILLGAGISALTLAARAPSAVRSLPALALAGSPAGGAAAGAGAPALLPLFLFFLKVGAVLFGSGYVLFAFLQADLVDRWHWLTRAQLIDAIAAGQLTPGPVFSAATFIGYLLGGVRGAAVATLGIFLPAFVFVALSGSIVPRIRRSRAASAFLDGVIAASLALMVAVTWRLGSAALVDPTTIGLAIVATALLLRTRVGSAWILLGGALIGVLARAVR